MSEIPQKETKAQRMERLKREKNPWEAFDEVRTFAREGRSSVVPEWASAYFKWWGVYTQGDGVGATGGKGGEGLTTEWFSARWHSQRHHFGQPAPHHRRNHAQVRSRSG